MVAALGLVTVLLLLKASVDAVVLGWAGKLDVSSSHSSSSVVVAGLVLLGTAGLLLVIMVVAGLVTVLLLLCASVEAVELTT